MCSRIYFAIVLFLFSIIDQLEGADAPYAYLNAKEIIPDPSSPDDIGEGQRFCGWLIQGQLSQECATIVQKPLFRNNNFRLISGKEVEEMQYIRIRQNRFGRGERVGACLCPTEPPMYLKNKTCGNETTVVIISQKNFVDTECIRVDPENGDGAGCSKCLASTGKCLPSSSKCKSCCKGDSSGDGGCCEEGCCSCDDACYKVRECCSDTKECMAGCCILTGACGIVCVRGILNSFICLGNCALCCTCCWFRCCCIEKIPQIPFV